MQAPSVGTTELTCPANSVNVSVRIHLQKSPIIGFLKFQINFAPFLVGVLFLQDCRVVTMKTHYLTPPPFYFALEL